MSTRTMSTMGRLAILSGALVLCWLALRGGGVAGRGRFDHPSPAALDRYAETVRQGQASRMPREQTAQGGREASAAPWVGPLQRVDDALAWKDVRVAERAWNAAYVAALGSGRWDGMVEVGEAYLRIGEVAGDLKLSHPTARRSYQEALFRARAEGSLDGVLRVAEAFAALGDGEVVEQCLRIAESLAARAGDPQVRDRVYAFREQLTNQLHIAAMIGRP